MTSLLTLITSCNRSRLTRKQARIEAIYLRERSFPRATSKQANTETRKGKYAQLCEKIPDGGMSRCLRLSRRPDPLPPFGVRDSLVSPDLFTITEYYSCHAQFRKRFLWRKWPFECVRARLLRLEGPCTRCRERVRVRERAREPVAFAFRAYRLDASLPANYKSRLYVARSRLVLPL